jgi:2,4-dienoyl-CoA reductase-like NADH-dependent reductase (Old Yellow Enzyme family)
MLFDSFDLGNIHLANHIVMAPMTRSRSTHNNTPSALVVQFLWRRSLCGEPSGGARCC